MNNKIGLLTITLLGIGITACGPAGSTAAPTEIVNSTPNPLEEAPAEDLPVANDQPATPEPREQGNSETGTGEPPLIRLVVDGEPVEGYQGSYCWTDPAQGVGLCVDKIPPEFDSAIPLPTQQPIQLLLDEPLPDSVTLSLSEDVFGEALASQSMQGMAVIEWQPQVQPGTYVLSVLAQWEQQGDVAYIFSVSLE